MKKIFKYILFLSIYTLSFSASHIDYELFTQGKNNYYMGQYEKAYENFNTLLRLFPKSNVFDKNYGYFFIGMNYYKLKDYRKACYYLQKATYIPKKFFKEEDNSINKTLFFSQRDYALGNSCININEVEKGIIYLKRLNYTEYVPQAVQNEAMALMTLGQIDPFYQDLCNLKFNFDFSKIKEFPAPKLLEIGEFYTSQKKYNLAIKFYEYIIDNKMRIGHYKKEVYKNYFENLNILKKYDEILKLTKNPPKRYIGIFNFYRAMAFYEKKDFTRALYLFKTVNDEDLKEKAMYYTSSIYYILNDYFLAIKYANKIQDKDMLTLSILGYSYLHTNNHKAFKKLYETYIEKYPNTYLTLYFKTINQSDFKLIDTNSMKSLGEFADVLINNSKSLPKNFIKKSDILEMKELNSIGEFGDRELLKINFDKGNFINSSDLSGAFATTLVLGNSHFYDLAFENSKQNMVKFMQYRELIYYEFPKYFSQTVNDISLKYDIPCELIYTILHNLSRFDVYFISQNLRFGLMGINYSDKYTFTELSSPKHNIEIGAEILKSYLEEYDGNEVKALIRYIYGKDMAESLKFENKNINFDSIIFPKERYEIKNTVLTYLFYKKLY